MPPYCEEHRTHHDTPEQCFRLREAARRLAADKARAKINREKAERIADRIMCDDDGSDTDGTQAQNGMNLLGDYADSDEEADIAATAAAFDINADEWGDDDAEGETDEEYEGSPEELAAMLQKLREAGALRDPGRDGALGGLGALDEEQVDWGESGDEEESGS